MTTEEAVRVIEQLGGVVKATEAEYAAYQNALSLLAERAKIQEIQTVLERRQLHGSEK
jgi:hypothetical protein